MMPPADERDAPPGVQRGAESFSVVVPTYARPEALAVTLDALLGMDYPASDFEVIVVDDGSDVATERVVRARQKGPIAMEYRAQPNSGAATARNHGARVAAGRHVFFCDDDIVVQRNHLRSVGGTLGKFSNALVNGDLHFAPRVEEELRRTPFGRYRLELDRRYQAEANGRPLGSGCFEADLLTACNLGVARDLFWELGGFDEAFPYAGAEDQALSLTASKQGCLLLRDHCIRVLHNDQTVSFRQFCSREEKSAQTFVVLVRRFPEQRDRPLFARNGPITRDDGVSVTVTKLGKAALSREPVLAALHRLNGRLEQCHVPERALRRMYRTVVGLHIFRGVRIAMAGRA
jgi:GT2 family glycosyltransferase